MVVDNALAGAKGDYGIAIKNLKNNESYYLNEHRVFDTGSLYKLWIMAVAYKKIEEGSLSKDKVLSGDEVTLTAGEALNQMITISHNDSALLLTKEVKLSTVALFLKENKFNESLVGTDNSEPKSSAADILSFYEKLYRRELGSTENTEKMINLLKNQKLNDGLPKYLPQELPIAHKTGDIHLFKHDAGIIITEKGDYIIVIMSESEFPLGAQERIALISKAVNDYFSKTK